MTKKNRLRKTKVNSNARKESKTFLENKWLAIGLIVLVSVVVYYNSLNAPFIFDDVAKIVKNPDIKQLSNIKTRLIFRYESHGTFEINDPSRPLTYLTFTLNYHFSKLNTFGYHLFNMLLHTFNGILIFLLTRKIIFYTYKEDSIIFSLFVSLFFVIHPVNTAVVTYIFARSGGLATLFYILSLLLFIKTFESNRKLYICSLFSFFLSLCSKPIAVTFPAIMLIFDYMFLSEYKIQKVIEKKYYHILFWVILIIYLLFRYFYLGGIGDIESEAPLKVSNYHYMITQLNIIIRYLKLLFIPAGLCIDHTNVLAKTIFESRVLLSILFYIGLILLTWKIYKMKNNISRIFLFCIIWFFITLSPTSSFFPTTSPMDDKRMYLSGFGFHLAVVFIYFLIFYRGKPFDRGPNWVLYGLMVIHLSLLGMTTVKRNQLYQDPVLIWQDVVDKYPQKYRAYHSLGLLHKDQKEYTKAIREFQKVLKIKPDHVEAHYNLGLLYEEQKEYTKAIREFQKTLKINPNYAAAYYNLGVLYQGQKEYTKAIQEFQKALEINSNDAKIHNNLGVLYYIQKDHIKAIREFQKATEINPNYAGAYTNLGNMWYARKEYAKAIREFQKTIEINPNCVEAHYNLGVVYEDQKNYTKAIQEYQKVLEIKPDYTKARNNLEALYIKK